MGSSHAVIIAYIRSHAKADFAEQLNAWSDEQMLRQMFSNYRDGHGLRLTKIGQHLMTANFQSYRFLLDESLTPPQLLFLDARAKMPYYCNDNEIVIFDPKFAVRLRLVDGNIGTLMEIDTPD